MLNVHVYPSMFRFESRILKETKSIVDLKLASEVIVLSRGERHQPVWETLSPDVRLFRIRSFGAKRISESSFMRALDYLIFYFRVIWFFRNRNVAVINCHSLMVLPLCVFIKIVKSAKLIYDPHELETERLGLLGVSRKISRVVERLFIRFIDSIIVVSPSIRRWYMRAYSLKNVVLIRNVPRYFNAPPANAFRERFGIPDNHLIYIYQGLLIPGRGIELLLEAFERVAGDRHLILMGYGSLEESVVGAAARLENIHYLPAVPPEEILLYTSSADVGLCTVENCCLSYYYSLANKFFEYIMAEVPAIVSDFPDMEEVVTRYGVGWVTPVTLDGIVSQIRGIDRSMLPAKKENARAAKRELSWEIEIGSLPAAFYFDAWVERGSN